VKGASTEFMAIAVQDIYIYNQYHSNKPDSCVNLSAHEILQDYTTATLCCDLNDAELFHIEQGPDGF
jgi:hypothetical protein